MFVHVWSGRDLKPSQVNVLPFKTLKGLIWAASFVEVAQ